MAIKNLGRVTGKSAYEIWLEQGNTGTEEDFLNSLKGGGVDVDLSGYATKDDLKTKADKTELHTHNNKSILDSITQKDIDKWNSGGGTGGSHRLQAVDEPERLVSAQ